MDVAPFIQPLSSNFFHSIQSKQKLDLGVDKTLHKVYISSHKLNRITESNTMNIKEQTWGFNSFAETFSGRVAMCGFLAALIVEALTGKGILGQLSSFFFFAN